MLAFLEELCFTGMCMTKAILAVAFATCIAQAPVGKGRVSFGGIWQLVEPSSEALDIGGVTGGGRVMTIVHTADAITIDRMYGRAAKQFVVRLDGRDSIQEDPLHLPGWSANLISRATWQGNFLQISTDRVLTSPDGKISRTKTSETLSLEAGKLLITVTQSSVGKPAGTSKRIYLQKPKLGEDQQ